MSNSGVRPRAVGALAASRRAEPWVSNEKQGTVQCLYLTKNNRSSKRKSTRDVESALQGSSLH